MQYTSRCESPLGGILLAADETGLTGLWFQGQKYFAPSLDKAYEAREHPVLAEAKRWLDIYFSGREPDFCPPLHFTGSAFQNEVWELLCGIPYGSTTTYGELAARLARRRGLPICPRRRWAARSEKTGFRSSSPATASSARTEA